MFTIWKQRELGILASTLENVPSDVHSKKIQISLRFWVDWSHEELLHPCLSKIRTVKILITETARMRRLIWIFAGRTYSDFVAQLYRGLSARLA